MTVIAANAMMRSSLAPAPPQMAVTLAPHSRLQNNAKLGDFCRNKLDLHQSMEILTWLKRQASRHDLLFA
ncbi:hypothetical protein [uncultured Bradyrhizobium sp.]|jgi:hypothetical protein|uniref:hypothetical protein n=1 Tax=uncultured Bradyrhizobium sp. TaxID=199684 RepID=UPI0026217DCC|nr:hypothetical protein [uncultured Bradyrhizobium sp.]